MALESELQHHEHLSPRPCRALRRDRWQGQFL